MISRGRPAVRTESASKGRARSIPTELRQIVIPPQYVPQERYAQIGINTTKSTTAKGTDAPLLLPGCPGEAMAAPSTMMLYTSAMAPPAYRKTRDHISALFARAVGSLIVP